MRALLLLLTFSALFAVVSLSPIQATLADIKDDMSKCKDFLKAIGKLNDEDRTKIANTARDSKSLPAMKEAAVELINMALNQIDDEKHEASKMINMHTLHNAEKVVDAKSTALLEEMHHKYEKHALFFQNDTWVRGLIFGSLGLVFLVSGYQAVTRGK